ncbi:MAG: primosomal protein N' (replication factor Y) - superfamily II helicase, partial [Armatimonadetes bacterium]|nr:primosomal protein N' (replication factor Y) - superfamily II helicase [Armatimonadota bacterium]
CSRELGGDTQRSLQVDTRFSDVTWKHLLLPVFVASYRYAGKRYHFLINGQTGEVAGQAPLSWWKILGAVLAAAAIAAAVYFVREGLR